MSKATTAAAYALYLLHALVVLREILRNLGSPLRKRSGIPVGATIFAFGLSLYAVSVKRFDSFGQLSGLEDGELVTGGVYLYTRNPQIVGWGLALLGAALAGRSGKALAFVVLYFLVHRLYFPFEERKLERVFGEEYRSYLARTPRFLGIPG